jgi:EAL domain-containing protein (putative c-di-GMP-specific phosphodiesterase class I)
VDDAGAGVANFAHIVELRPNLVKLDIGLVRGVTVDPGRQALVIAMRHFGRATGCHLIAEGIETPEEADTLRGLGVEFGQGYLWGKPGPAETFAHVMTASPTRASRKTRTTPRATKPVRSRSRRRA